MPAHVAVPYPASNSTVRARALRWIDRLRADVTVHGPGFSQDRVPSGAPLLLIRNARAVSRGRREARALRRASLGVYDLDDGLPWDDGRLPGHERWQARLFPRSLIARRSAGAADRVVVGNQVLADWASAHCADVRIVPTCVEPADYEVRTTWSLERVPVMGWIGSPATERYLDDIAPSLAEVHRTTGARLVIVSGRGSTSPALQPFTERIEWSPAADRLIAGWDVGLMPLRNGVYERAKCGYKLLQYAASGVPAIGSPVGVNDALLADMDGLRPETTDDWVDALRSVLGEPASRRERRAAAGLAVARAYSYATWEGRFADAVGWSLR